jgi:hypothetical protein
VERKLIEDLGAAASPGEGELDPNPKGNAHVDAGFGVGEEAKGTLGLEDERSVGKHRP